ncbi:MAG: PH domain-containing protein [Clostridia bacterium]|nr:PH domain-containing protein [Clostridia bacterium]
MTHNRINKKAVKAWIISRLITCTIIMSVYGVGIYLFLLPIIKNERLIYWIHGVSGLLLLFLLSYIFIFPLVEYKEWRYSITDDRIDLFYGIFVRTHMVIPISRIQYIDVGQGPIDRLLGIAAITINTAGGVHRIPALTNEEAKKISSGLTNIIQAGDDDE